MPKLVNRSPSYRLHKPTGQAVVTFNGRDHYLGKHGTKTSRKAYDRFISEWLANGRRSPKGSGGAPDLTVVELLAAYWKHATSYYRKDGPPTSPVAIALKPSSRHEKAISKGVKCPVKARPPARWGSPRAGHTDPPPSTVVNRAASDRANAYFSPCPKATPPTCLVACRLAGENPSPEAPAALRHAWRFPLADCGGVGR